MLRPFDPFASFTAPGSVEYDVVRTEHGVSVRVDLPGVDPESIDLTVDHRSLTLRAERSDSLPEGAVVTSHRNRPRRINQTFHLGHGLDTDALAADVTHGVLTISIPVAESAKPRKVAVGVGAPAGIDAIEADSEDAEAS